MTKALTANERRDIYKKDRYQTYLDLYRQGRLAEVEKLVKYGSKRAKKDLYGYVISQTHDAATVVYFWNLIPEDDPDTTKFAKNKDRDRSNEIT